MDILKKEGFAGVRDLGERLYASQPTIRRDLDFLEKEGLVRRSHGGAVPADDRVNTPISYRKGRRMHEKMQIAALAATLIENDQFIFIDGSTTALCLADFLAEHEGISVLTNGMQLLGLGTYPQYIAKGALMLISLYLSNRNAKTA